MINYFRYIFIILSAIIVLVNIWFLINLSDSYQYDFTTKNIDLILKNVWINFGITKGLLILNSIYILLLTVRTVKNKI